MKDKELENNAKDLKAFTRRLEVRLTDKYSNQDQELNFMKKSIAKFDKE